MGLLLTIDPGECMGWAWFKEGLLLKCGYDEEHDPFFDEGQDVVIEDQFIYPGHKGKGDGNDLLKVAWISGRLTACIPKERITKVLPRTWKGSVPKEIMLKRIVEKLSLSEQALIPKLPKKKLHNVIDAVGIGLWHLGRLSQASGSGGSCS